MTVLAVLSDREIISHNFLLNLLCIIMTTYTTLLINFTKHLDALKFMELLSVLSS